MNWSHDRQLGVLSCIPAVQRSQLLTYGSRSVDQKKDIAKSNLDRTVAPPEKGSSDLAHRTEQRPNNNAVARIVERINAVVVPHSWFYYFYAFSSVASAFWLQQIISRGTPIVILAQLQCPAPLENSTPSMTSSQMLLTVTLVILHSARRLYESIEFSRSSLSSMPLAHWGLGVSFFAALSVSTWIHGSADLLSDNSVLRFTSWSLLSYFSAPSIRTVCCLSLYLLASGIQHDCHDYLAGLRKYTLPRHPAFKSLLCPHYTAECVIYLSLAVIAAPAGSIVNPTLFTTLYFTVVNLAITAEGTRQSYTRRFGADQIQGKWRMIPWIW